MRHVGGLCNGTLMKYGILRWETTRLNLQGPRHEMPFLFWYNLHEGRYLCSLLW